jgi:hypothetical protein
MNIYNRQFYTGVYSHCTYAIQVLHVNAPFANIPSLSNSNTPINYLLKIREFDVIKTTYNMPKTAKPE